MYKSEIIEETTIKIKFESKIIIDECEKDVIYEAHWLKVAKNMFKMTYLDHHNIEETKDILLKLPQNDEVYSRFQVQKYRELIDELFDDIDDNYKMSYGERKDYTYDEAVEYMEDKDSDFNISSEKWFALSKQLDLSLSELENIKRDDDKYFSYGKQEWLILDEYEVDGYEREYVENLIEDCFLYEYRMEEKKSGRSNPLLQYVDKDKWIDDLCGDRGNHLSGYDGVEYGEKVNDTWYYLYRQN